MSFSIRLAEDMISVEAGVTVPLGVEIANRDEDQDRYEMEIEGLDPEWTAVPVPTFTVSARENHTEKVFFKPGRVSESVAGNYPFVIRVRSLENGEVRTAQGVLNIKPYHHLSMEVNPKKGMVSPFKQLNDFSVTVVNLGNTEHTIQLYGNDPDDECAFEFEHEQINLAPGQQRAVNVRVTPGKGSLVSSTRLHGFSLSGRSIENPAIVCSTQAQIEQRPILAPSTLVAFLIFLVVAAGWIALRPQPPSIEINLSKSVATKGEEITVSWKASDNAKSVDIEVQGQELYSGGMLSGQKSFVANETGLVTATAYRDGKSSGPRVVQFTVNPPVVAPDPEILVFDVNPKQVPSGQPIIIRYKFNDAVKKATLVPKNLPLDPKIDTIQIDAEEPGKVSFSIVVENADGKTAKSRVVTIEVQQVSEASIVVFRSEPDAISTPEGGTVKLVWQLTNAVRAELNDGVKTVPLSATEGEMEVPITATSSFTLIGYDAKGVVVKKNIQVVVKAPPPNPTPTTGGDPTPPTTGGGN